MNMEDASVLAKLFSHLRDEAQIVSFLYAFQNLREERCLKNRDLDISNIWFLVEREGEVVARRDSMMRARYDQGLDVLSGNDEDTTVAQWDHNRELFGYDAEDAADTWWVQWGLLQERANATRWENNTQLEMFSLDAHVRMS
jgi:salicylate hydroxylase